MVVSDAQELVFDENAGGRGGRRLGVVDLGKYTALFVEAKLVVDRYAQIRCVKIPNKRACVVQPGHLGLCGPRKIGGHKCGGQSEQEPLVGVSGLTAAIESRDQAAVVDPQQIGERLAIGEREGLVDGIVDRYEATRRGWLGGVSSGVRFPQIEP